MPPVARAAPIVRRSTLVGLALVIGLGCPIALGAGAQAQRAPAAPSRPVPGPAPFDRPLAPREASASPDSTALCRVSCTVLDALTGEPISARSTITASDSLPAYPLPPSSCFFQDPEGDHPSYFYTDGTFSIKIPPGRTIFGFGHGFEYAVVTDTVDVRGDTSLVYVLERQIDMNDLGWFSGDCHVHLAHECGPYFPRPEDALFMGSGEGLNVVNCMDGRFAGEPDSCSTPDCVVYVNQELRSFVYGHSALMGLSSRLDPESWTWWPLIMDAADSAHAQPRARIVSAHPANAADFFDLESTGGTMKARELPVDLAVCRIDGIEVLSSGFLHAAGEINLWYGLLNCGFRVSPCAGTDAAMDSGRSPIPLGAFKVYARIEAAEFDYWNWLEALFDGETFVTNGPLITDFSVASLAPGDSVSVAGVDSLVLDGRLSVASAFPLRRADIVRNGDRIESFSLPGGRCELDTTFSVTIDESSWVAARVYGVNDSWFTVEDSLFAHTGPIYFELDGERILEVSDAQYFAEWVSHLELLASACGEWSEPAESLRVADEFARARRYYEALADGVVTGLPAQHGVDRAMAPPVLGPSAPNPFSGAASTPFSVPHECRVSLAVFAPSGRLVRTLAEGRFPAGHHTVTWDGRDGGEHPVASGVYFVRMEAGDWTGVEKLVVLR